MKNKVIITILSFFNLFLSALNLSNGLTFHTTDTTEYDAKYSISDAKEPESTAKKPEIKTINVPKKQTTVKTTTATKKTTVKTASAPKNSINITGKTITLKPTDCNKMPTPDYSSANYCHFRGSSSLFVYGHNVSSIFGAIKNLRTGSTFKITLNGKTTTYKITSSFVLPVAVLNDTSSNASSLRASLYNGTYGEKSDITIQTCEGKNDVNRRYIKAVKI